MGKIKSDIFHVKGINRFIMTPSKWIEQTGAIGITSKAGRYGGSQTAASTLIS